MNNERIDLTQLEESIETANAYMESWFKGTVTPMNGKEWRDIKDLGLHVDWSHNEVFGPLVEEFPALIAELKRCYEELDKLPTRFELIEIFNYHKWLEYVESCFLADGSFNQDADFVRACAVNEKYGYRIEVIDGVETVVHESEY